ncbi:hypothetical protein [Paramicrobacterium agarici]|uniref:hypothetical protein n=1 Tax=Paramicrobacterium agarici TaxID=630514 RepID=UPI001153DCEC|nr:hypothetical protein [Microbacterium agarici]TQO24274.1 hypothetical protein FB385_3154 [Microbacterium agarici]
MAESKREPRVAVAIRQQDGTQRVTAWSSGVFAGQLRAEAQEAAEEGALVRITPTLEVLAEAETELGAIASIVLAAGVEDSDRFVIRAASDKTYWAIIEAEALALEAAEEKSKKEEAHV